MRAADVSGTEQSPILRCRPPGVGSSSLLPDLPVAQHPVQRPDEPPRDVRAQLTVGHVKLVHHMASTAISSAVMARPLASRSLGGFSGLLAMPTPGFWRR